MQSKLKNYSVILFITVIYAYAIIEKAMGWTNYSLTAVLRNNLLLIFLVLTIVFLLNRYYLKQSIKSFFEFKAPFIVHLVVGLLLLSIIYTIHSVGKLTYFEWYESSVDERIHNTLKEILDNKFYTFILLGPFVWLSEIFGVITRVFFLNSFWKIQNSKGWQWLGIVFLALLFSLLQIEKGIPEMINSFLIITVSNIFYLKYRNSIPLIIATVLYTTIDLIAFWVYQY